MYQNLRGEYWWNNMKREIAQFVSRCLVCQQVKVEHQNPEEDIATFTYLGMEMGAYYNGFCFKVT